MSDQQRAPTVQVHPAPEGYTSWPKYWAALEMPWRTEPEIDLARQAFLRDRRSISPDHEQGEFPFEGVVLTRADIEWLLATHESGGTVGPVDWDDERQRNREGLDLRGADLASTPGVGRRKEGKTTAVDLSHLPLARLRAGAPFASEREFGRSQLVGVAAIVWFLLTWILGLFIAAATTPLIPLIAITAPLAINAFMVLIGSIAVFMVALAFLGPVIDLLEQAMEIGLTGWRKVLTWLAWLVAVSAVGVPIMLILWSTALFFESGAYGFDHVAEYLEHFGYFSVPIPAFGQYFVLALLALVLIRVSNSDIVDFALGLPDYARLSQSAQSGARLDECNLTGAHLEGAQLGGASLRRANLFGAHLEHANLDLAQCQGADFRRAVFDEATSMWWMQLAYRRVDLRRLDLTDPLSGDEGGTEIAALGNVVWNGADLTKINWRPVRKLGDERYARMSNLISLQETVKTYHQLAQLLRAQGLFAPADRFAYRALVFQRKVLLRVSGVFPAMGSGLLDVLAGYGYKPGRSLVWYVVTICGFALGYFQVTHGVPLLGVTTPTGVQPLKWYEAIVLSVSSFHGRGFFQPLQNPGDPVAILAAAEAVIGLLIEISFIATFTQRFLARSGT